MGCWNSFRKSEGDDTRLFSWHIWTGIFLYWRHFTHISPCPTRGHSPPVENSSGPSLFALKRPPGVRGMPTVSIRTSPPFLDLHLLQRQLRRWTSFETKATSWYYFPPFPPPSLHWCPPKGLRRGIGSIVGMSSVSPTKSCRFSCYETKRFFEPLYHYIFFLLLAWAISFVVGLKGQGSRKIAGWLQLYKDDTAAGNDSIGFMSWYKT